MGRIVRARTATFGKELSQLESRGEKADSLHFGFEFLGEVL